MQNKSLLTPFDKETLNDATLPLKLLILFLPPNLQQIFGIGIRMLELNLTIDYYRKHKETLKEASLTSLEDLYKLFSDYLSKEELDNINMLLNLMKAKQFEEGMKNAKASPDMLMSFLSKDAYDKYLEYENIL